MSPMRIGRSLEPWVATGKLCVSTCPTSDLLCFAAIPPSRAISLLLSGESFAARAFPPLARPTATTPNPWVETPTEPGYWWVWKQGWPCDGRVHCVLVEQNPIRAWVPGMDYDEPVQVDDSDWTGAKWLGPVAAPEAPAS